MNKTRIFLTKGKNSHGFTLIELLIVITIIATLAVAVFVALNPARRLKDAKDARRTSDVQTILTAIHSCIVDGKGTCTGFPAGTLAITQIGTAASGCDGVITPIGGAACTVAVAQAACLNLGGTGNPLEKYLKANPIDPDGTAVKTKYTVEVDANGLVTVKACGAEGGTLISASR
jgi:prepilin-type N-terminal cleavage/methylation domain-containing protein